MPARNAEETICRSVRSTLKALGPGDELLVGLHNCTDLTSVRLREIKDSRLRIEIFEGGSFAEVLNSLIDRCSFSLVARMDADDYCLPWRFRIQKKLAQRYPGGMLFGTAIISLPIWVFRFWVPQYPFRLSDAEVRGLLAEVNPLNHPTLFASKKVIQDLGGYHSVAGEDLDLWLRASLQDVPLFRSALPLVVYRLSESQLSRSTEYIAGWTTSAAIRNARLELHSRLSDSDPTFSRWSRVKMWLQRLGLPTPNRLFRDLAPRLRRK